MAAEVKFPVIKEYRLICGHSCFLRVSPARNEEALYCARCCDWQEMDAPTKLALTAQRTRLKRVVQSLGVAPKSRRQYMGLDVAREIRELAAKGHGRTQIAQRFGVNPRTVYDVVNNVTWKEV